MNWLQLLQFVPLILQYGPQVASALQTATSNADVLTKIEQLAPTVGSLVSSVGAALFPKSSAALQQIGGAIAAFDPNTTMWVQKTCNQLLATAAGYVPLAVDGHYGPKTIAAVEQLQAKYGLAVDGIAGKVTQQVIAGVLGALPRPTA